MKEQSEAKEIERLWSAQNAESIRKKMDALSIRICEECGERLRVEDEQCDSCQAAKRLAARSEIAASEADRNDA